MLFGQLHPLHRLRINLDTETVSGKGRRESAATEGNIFDGEALISDKEAIVTSFKITKVAD